MTSYVESQVQARIAAVAAKAQQQQEERRAFAERRAAGLVSRKRQKLARRCAVCERPLKGGRGKPCVRGCGARLCRTQRRPPCSDVHGGQCAHLHGADSSSATMTETVTTGEAS